MTQAPGTDGWSLTDTEVFLRYGDACVPRREEQIAIVCDLLEAIPVSQTSAVPSERHVLDVCCGEGRLSEEFLRRDPRSRVTIMDGSPEMLAMAAIRLGPFGDRHDEVHADIADRSWRQGVRYGGVMTSLAVHHLDDAGKQQLYRDVRDMLVPGGVFVMADLVEPTGPAARKLAGDQWDEAVRQASERMFGDDEAALVFRDTEWNYFRLPCPDPVDRPSSVAEHLSWLDAAGFGAVDLAWMFAGHAIFTATRLS